MKEVLTTKDLAEILCIGKTKAYQIMREIRYVSDTLKISGIVHRQDYEAYLEARKGVIGKSK